MDKKEKDIELSFLDEVGTESFSSDVSSIANQLKANRKREKIQLDTIKAISSIAKQQRETAKHIQTRELGYTKGVATFEKSANKILQKLGLTVDTLSRSATKVLVTTAVVTKNAITDMGKALNEELRLNKANTVGMALAATTPIFGYFASRFMETNVFRDFSDKIKEKLGDAVSYVGEKFKSFFKEFKGKKFSELLSMAGKGIQGFLKLPFVAIGASFKALWEGSKFLLKLPFKAIGLAFKGILGVTKFITSIPFKALGLAFKTLLMPFKMIKGIFGAIRSGYRLDFLDRGKSDIMPPALQKGGYVKKGGLANVHAAEIITPVSKFYKEFSSNFIKTIEQSALSEIPLEIRNLRYSISGLGSTFTMSLYESLTKGKLTSKLIGLFSFFKTVTGTIKFLTRPRGKYSRQLPRATNPLQNTSTILGMLYANGMSKLDQIIRILGGNPEDETTKAGSIIDEKIGLLGAVKEKLGQQGITSSILDFSEDKLKKIREGLYSFFGNSFYKSWRRAINIDEDNQKENINIMDKVKKATESTSENVEKLGKKLKKAVGWLPGIAIMAFNFLKGIAIGGYKWIKDAGLAIAALGGWIKKGAMGKFLGKGIEGISKFFGKGAGGIAKSLIGIFGQTFALGLKILGKTAGVMALGFDFFKGAIKAEETLGKRKGERVSLKERFLAGGITMLSSSKGGPGGAIEGAIKGLAVGNLPGLLIGTILGAIGAKNLIGLSKAIISDTKFAMKISYDAMAKPLVDAISGTIDMMKQNTKNWIEKKFETGGLIGELIQPILDNWKDKAKKWLDRNPKITAAADAITNTTVNFLKQTQMIVSSVGEAMEFSNVAKTIKDAFVSATTWMGKERDWGKISEIQEKQQAQYKALTDKSDPNYYKKENVAKRAAMQKSLTKSSNLPIMDTGGFVGGRDHKNIIAHKDEYVVDPSLSKSLKETSRKTGMNPKDIIKNSLNGGKEDFEDAVSRFESKFEEMSSTISLSIIAGFKLILEGLKPSFGGGGIIGSMVSGGEALGKFAGRGFEKLKIGAKKIGGAISSGVSAVGGSALGLLGIKIGGSRWKADLSRVNPRLLDSVKAMASEYRQLTGKDITITEGYRTEDQQKMLLSGKNKYLVAQPGMSMHQYGQAIDMDKNDANRLSSMGLLSKYGLVQPYPSKDPVHIEPASIQGRRNEVRSGVVGDGVLNPFTDKKGLAIRSINTSRAQNGDITNSILNGMNESNRELSKTLKEVSDQTTKNTSVLNVINNNMSTISSSNQMNSSQNNGSLNIEESLLRGDFPA